MNSHEHLCLDLWFQRREQATYVNVNGAVYSWIVFSDVAPIEVLVDPRNGKILRV